VSLTKDLVTRALTTVDDDAGQDLVTGGALQWVSACDSYATIKINLRDGADQPTMVHIAGEADRSIRRAASREGIDVSRLEFQFVDQQGEIVFRVGGEPGNKASGAKPAATPAPGGGTQGEGPDAGAGGNALPQVRHVIAVGAGKGGVGKSTVAVNLAVGLARAGHSVGILDGDIYGPSLPTLLGLDALEQVVHEGQLQPHQVHGVRAITLGRWSRRTSPSSGAARWPTARSTSSSPAPAGASSTT
jgi:ATP-binding protein involved in chromosome partitioning